MAHVSVNDGAVDTRAAFLNLPYDPSFAHLYTAYIVGITAFGLVPRVTLEVPGGERRLDRIFDLIRTCRYSFHDLSRVELDKRRPPTPRLNMPFELGLAVAWERTHPGDHLWFVLESKPRRVQKSLSDLGGTDVHIHHGQVKGVFRELGNALVRVRRQPTVPEMQAIYRRLKAALPGVQRSAGTQSLYEARVFKEVSVLARTLANEVMQRSR